MNLQNNSHNTPSATRRFELNSLLLIGMSALFCRSGDGTQKWFTSGGVDCWIPEPGPRRLSVYLLMFSLRFGWPTSLPIPSFRLIDELESVAMIWCENKFPSNRWSWPLSYHRVGSYVSGLITRSSASTIDRYYYYYDWRSTNSLKSYSVWRHLNIQ